MNFKLRSLLKYLTYVARYARKKYSSKFFISSSKPSVELIQNSGLDHNIREPVPTYTYSCVRKFLLYLFYRFSLKIGNW